MMKTRTQLHQKNKKTRTQLHQKNKKNKNAAPSEKQKKIITKEQKDGLIGKEKFQKFYNMGKKLL